MKVVIVDDESSARNILKKFLSVYCPEVTVIAECTSVKEGYECITKNEFDILFLDIHLTDGEGFDLLQKIPKITFEIIFTTGYDTYAIKAIKYAAIDYLVKPLIAEELKEAVDRVIKKKADNVKIPQAPEPKIQLLPTSGRIAVSDTNGLRILQLNKIIYCKAEGNYTSFILSDKEKILVCKTLKEYETILPQPYFLRIHNSHLINLEHVKSYVNGRGGQVEMSNNEFLDVARNRKQSLMDIITGHF